MEQRIDVSRECAWQFPHELKLRVRDRGDGDYVVSIESNGPGAAERHSAAVPAADPPQQVDQPPAEEDINATQDERSPRLGWPILAGWFSL